MKRSFWHVINGVKYKVCPCCGENKPQTAYSVDRRASSGMSSYCLYCARQRALINHYKNPQRIREIPQGKLSGRVHMKLRVLAKELGVYEILYNEARKELQDELRNARAEKPSR